MSLCTALIPQGDDVRPDGAQLDTGAVKLDKRTQARSAGRNYFFVIRKFI
jgi:hypothetical protein